MVDGQVFTAQMLSTLGEEIPVPIAALPKYDSAPANRYRLPDGTTFGIVKADHRAILCNL